MAVTSHPGTPIIILGAPRSGTNMLRDVLTRLPGLGTWPCDEINYVWRYGNAWHPNDELQAEHATPRTQEYIRKCFSRLISKYSLHRAVEKTCANSLRVDFVERVVPDAMYIFLVRDGRDAVASAMKRWTASLDLKYVLSKARYVPARDIPYYAARFLHYRAHRALSRDAQLGSWGPRFEGLDTMLADATLEEVCATQWARCVATARDGLARIAGDRQIILRYEDFVLRPREQLEELLSFLAISVTEEQKSSAIENVIPSRVGQGSALMNESAWLRIAGQLNPLLTQYGYQPGESRARTTSTAVKAA